MSVERKQVGFSLIEMMTVVAIIAILGSIAYPSYTAYVTRANRTDAMETMSEIMNQQQRFVLRNRRYATNLTQLGYGSSVVVTNRGLYSIAASVCGVGVTIQRCVLLTATPQGAQAGDGSITINSRGQKQWKGKDGWFHRE